MALRSGTSRTRTQDRLSAAGDWADDWSEPEKPQRDWKKLFLIGGLAALSWVATYVGMLELIKSNMGDLPLLHKIIIGFSVAMLMTMVVWLLDQMFSPIDWFTKLTYIGGYIFLTIISVGFGFGFYWKVLESRAEASRSAESAVGQVQSSLHGASTRLEQLQATLLQLSAISTEKAEIERNKGTSCPNSSPGDGPRRKMRDEDAARFTFASDFVKARVTAVKGDMAALDTELAKILADDPAIIDAKSGTRNEFMRALGRKLDLTVTGFNAFRTDPQLRQIRADLADRAGRTTLADTHGGTIACPDPQLQVALRGVVAAIDQLPNLEKPEIAAVEGSEATIEAFRRLTATFYGLLSFKLPPSADELRELQQKAVQSIENPSAHALNDQAAGLSKRDYIPLGVAVFVDLCLLLVSIGRPMNRFVATRQRMIEAERGPVFPILSRFSEIHDHEEMRRTFDVFREVIFESGGTYYVAVPLNAPRGHPERERLRRDAQALANLCYALEGQGVLARPWKLAPSLVARRKLRRQGSKFIECYRDQQLAPMPRAWRALKSLFVTDRSQDEQPAFRIYAFKSGAWPELILGAVMGAASRIEAERRRNAPVTEVREEPTGRSRETDDFYADLAREQARMAAQDAAPGIDLPSLDDTAPSTHDRGHNGAFAYRPAERPSLDGSPSAARRSAVNGAAAADLRPAGGELRPAGSLGAAAPRPNGHYRSQFGTYANQAQAEFANFDPDDDEDGEIAPATVVAEAANGNTGPVDSDRKPAEQPTEVIVVPFPSPRAAVAAPKAQDPLIERLTTALNGSDDVALQPGPSIGVELRRETATFTVPVSQASLPAALAKLTGARLIAEEPVGAPELDATGTPPETIHLGAESPTETVLSEDHSQPTENADFEPPLVLRRMVE
ncbi:MAG: hypothetical protein ACXWJS_03910 [Hyphomicrobium sp.]